MRTQLQVLLASIAGLSATTAGAQEPAWSLPALQQLLVHQSPQLTAERARIEGGAAAISLARVGYLPRIDAQASYDDYLKIARVLQFDEPDPYSLASYRLTARQTIYDGGRTRRKVAIAKEELRQIQLMLLRQEYELRSELVDHFFDAASAEIDGHYLPRMQALATERLTIVEEQFETGMIDRLVRLQATTSAQTIREQMLVSDLHRNLAVNEMSRLINVDPEFWQQRAHFDIPPAIAAPPAEALDGRGIEEQLAITSVSIAREKYAEIGAPRAPQIAAYANIGHRALDTFRTNDVGLEKSVGVAVTWGLTDALTNRHERRQAKSAISQAEADLQTALRRHQHRVQSIIRRREHEQGLLELQTELLSLQQERLAGARLTAARGIIGRAALLVEEQQTLSAKLDLEKARLNVRRQEYLLDLIIRFTDRSLE